MAITPDDPHTRDAAALPRGLYGPDEVDVAYEPWRARCVTRLRVGPSAQAPVVLTEAGDPVMLRAGDHLGRQSTRNPACLDTPPLRPAVDGWVWGYGVPPASRKSGWARLADLAADPAFAPSTCGPAGEDFDRRRPGSCGGHCDGRPLTDVGVSSGRADVAAREVYLRYAPRSTAFRYLVAGDEVRRLARWPDRDPRWVGVEVVRARWAPARTRGWVLAEELRDRR